VTDKRRIAVLGRVLQHADHYSLVDRIACWWYDFLKLKEADWVKHSGHPDLADLPNHLKLAIQNRIRDIEIGVRATSPALCTLILKSPEEYPVN